MTNQNKEKKRPTGENATKEGEAKPLQQPQHKRTKRNMVGKFGEIYGKKGAASKNRSVQLLKGVETVTTKGK